jgi:carbonic anhydrase/acetyltransferase-like protein (isoleucine patch superfamily)
MNEPRRWQAQIRDVVFGHGVTVVEPVNLYECVIGDECFIGPFVEIQRGVRIGRRTRVQSHSFICELVTIGEECFIGHGVMFINDTFQLGVRHPAVSFGSQRWWATASVLGAMPRFCPSPSWTMSSSGRGQW